MDKLIERPGTPAFKRFRSLSRISSLSRGFASRSLASLSSSSLSSMARKLDFKSLEYSSRINLGTPSPALDDISIGSTSSNFNPGLNLPLILKVDPNFALFQFGKRLLYKINAFRDVFRIKASSWCLPKLENIIAYGSKVLKVIQKTHMTMMKNLIHTLKSQAHIS